MIPAATTTWDGTNMPRHRSKAPPDGVPAIAPLLAENLVRLRAGLGLSQDAAAEKMGIARTMLSNMEGGAWNPTISTLEKVAAVYNIELTDLFRSLPHIGAKPVIVRRKRRPAALKR